MQFLQDIPYNDPWLIAAQLASIAAVCIGWIWWVVFLTNFIGMVILQRLWFYRVSRATMGNIMFMAALNMNFNRGLATKISDEWKDQAYCHVWVFSSSSSVNDDDRGDQCHAETWYRLAIWCHNLWGIALICLIVFTSSGRYKKLEEKHTQAAAAATRVEMANAESGDGAVTNFAMLETPNEKVTVPTIVSSSFRH